jgi:ribonuclease R
LKLVYILRLLEQHIGDEYEGLVTGVTNFGVFVQLPECLVEGLLRFSDLPEDWWEVDSEAGCVIGQRTGRRLKIGDAVRVTIAAIDLANRELDLALARPAGPTAPATGRRQRDGKRRGRRVKKTATARQRRAGA